MCVVVVVEVAVEEGAKVDIVIYDMKHVVTIKNDQNFQPKCVCAHKNLYGALANFQALHIAKY